MPSEKPGHKDDAADPCQWCGGQHGPHCPIVKAFELDPTTGAVTRVEFLTPIDFPRSAPMPEPETDYPRKGG